MHSKEYFDSCMLESYKDRLRQFNSTEKYRGELGFLKLLLDINYEHDENELILDYGCGLGTAMNEFMCDGYDVNDYFERKEYQGMFCSSITFDGKTHSNLPEGPYKHIYFMHSLAHIPNIKEVLVDLKKRYNATVTVITPNRHWLMMQSNINYTPDPTVVRHYTMTELKELFVSCGYEVTLCGQFGDEASGINERIFLQAI